MSSRSRTAAHIRSRRSTWDPKNPRHRCAPGFGAAHPRRRIPTAPRRTHPSVRLARCRPNSGRSRTGVESSLPRQHPRLGRCPDAFSTGHAFPNIHRPTIRSLRCHLSSVRRPSRHRDPVLLRAAAVLEATTVDGRGTAAGLLRRQKHRPLPGALRHSPRPRPRRRR